MKLLKPLLFIWIDLLSVLVVTSDIARILKKEKLKAETTWLRKFQFRTFLLVMFMVLLNVSVGGLTYFGIKSISASPEYRGRIIKTIAKKKSLPEQAKLQMKAAGIALAVNVFINLLTFSMHPVLTESRKLKKLTLDEKNPGLARCWLPIGVYMDTYGQDAKNIVQDERIWSAMNMVVDKDMVYESPMHRTRKFFVSSFELEDGYNYDVAITKPV